MNNPKSTESEEQPRKINKTLLRNVELLKEKEIEPKQREQVEIPADTFLNINTQGGFQGEKVEHSENEKESEEDQEELEPELLNIETENGFRGVHDQTEESEVEENESEPEPEERY